MAKVYEFLANGTEEVEALITIDILRRGGVDVKMVSTTGSEYIESAHGIVIKCDQMLFLPIMQPARKSELFVLLL